MRRSSSNIYISNSQTSKRLYLQNKKNTNIIIPKSKKDFIKKELLKNKSILYQPNNNHNELNINIDKQNISSLLMSSTFYPNQIEKMNIKKIMSNNPANNLIEDKNKNKIQYNLSSRNIKGISNINTKNVKEGLCNEKSEKICCGRSIGRSGTGAGRLRRWR